MPGRRILQSPSAARRLAEAESWIANRGGDGEILLLCAHRESADQLARTLASRRGALFGVRRFTLDSLVYQLALPVLAERGLATQSRLADEALSARILHQARAAGELGPLEVVSNWPGLARALAQTVSQLRLHEVTPASLAAAGSAASALAQLLARFEEAAGKAGVADRATVLNLAIEAAEGGRPPVGLPALLLDLPLTCPLEEHFIAALARRTPAVLATVPAGDNRSLRALQRALEVDALEVEAPQGVSPAVARLQSFLFSEVAPPRAASDPDVLLLPAPGEAQEAVELARVIQAEAERGVPFDSMAILLRAPEVYTPLLEDALARAGVPSHFEQGTLRPDPAGRAFLALLDSAAEGLSASRFAEYLSLGQIPELDERGRAKPLREGEETWSPPLHDLAPPAAPLPPREEPLQLKLFAEPEKVPAIEGTLRAPWRWEKLLVDASVIGGRERWERRLAGLARELAERLKEVDDPEGAEAAALCRQIEDLEHLGRFALPVIGLLAELPIRAIWGEWLDALELLAARVLASPEGVLSLLKELRPMESVGPVGLFEVRQVLAERLTLLAQQPPKYRYGRVWVAPIEAARGLCFEVVLVPGLAERIFPRKIVEDPLLLDSQRKRLKASLPQQEDRIAQERLDLHLAVGAARRKLVLSYPSLDLQKGRSRVPSFYLLEVVRASEGELPDLEALERRAAASRGSRLGWPAPRDAFRALDEAEHDLAFLADALRPESAEEKARGTGRYLIEANPALARSLRARYRQGRDKFTSADGLVEPSTEAKRALGAHRLGARAYSATALERFGACPYRFFLHAIHGLRPRESVAQITHLDPLTRGRILHQAQFKILTELKRSSQLPVRSENLSPALEVCEKVFNQVAAEFADELAPAIDRIWRDELSRIRTDLRGWLRKESLAPGGWVPHRFEFTFGMRPRGQSDPASLREEAVLPTGMRLRGSIDLIEARADGKVRVTDHKSGRARVSEGAIIAGGESLQPILYALAYEAVTGEQVASARLYYCTEREGYAERLIEPNEEALKAVEEFRRRVEKSIEEGFFPAFPREGCAFCDYVSVCGPRAEAIARHKQEDPRLHWLKMLRTLI